MTTQHTPGPWHANGTQIIGKHGRRNQYIADCLRDVGAEQATANAHLIAAAPEMLAALRGLINFPDTVAHTFENDGSGRLWREAVRDAEDAIARATGKATP